MFIQNGQKEALILSFPFALIISFYFLSFRTYSFLFFPYLSFPGADTRQTQILEWDEDTDR